MLQQGSISGLGTSRISYARRSFGGIDGVQLLGLDPDIRAGVPNVPGGLIASRATLFRNDLAFANVPGYTVKNLHTFLTNVFDPVQAPFAFEAQAQMATFPASGGQRVIDPDGAGLYFETPTSMVPEDLAYLP